MNSVNWTHLFAQQRPVSELMLRKKQRHQNSKTTFYKTTCWFIGRNIFPLRKASAGSHCSGLKMVAQSLPSRDLLPGQANKTLDPPFLQNGVICPACLDQYLTQLCFSPTERKPVLNACVQQKNTGKPLPETLQ